MFFLSILRKAERKGGKDKTQSLSLLPCPPGGVLSFSKAEKKERKKLLLYLTLPPSIFGAKNLIKPGRSRIQSPGTAPGFEEPRLPFCQLLGFEAKG